MFYDHNKIKELRQQLGLTQADFGARIGRNRGIVHQWEIGSSTPNLNDYAKIKTEFNVEDGYFFAENDVQYIVVHGEEKCTSQ